MCNFNLNQFEYEHTPIFYTVKGGNTMLKF